MLSWCTGMGPGSTAVPSPNPTVLRAPQAARHPSALLLLSCCNLLGCGGRCLPTDSPAPTQHGTAWHGTWHSTARGKAWHGTAWHSKWHGTWHGAVPRHSPLRPGDDASAPTQTLGSAGGSPSATIPNPAPCHVPAALTCGGAGAAAPLSGSRRSRRNPLLSSGGRCSWARGTAGRAAPELRWHLPHPQQCHWWGSPSQCHGAGETHTTGLSSGVVCSPQEEAALGQAMTCIPLALVPNAILAPILQLAPVFSRHMQGPGVALLWVRAPVGQDEAPSQPHHASKAKGCSCPSPAPTWQPGAGHGPGAPSSVTTAVAVQGLVVSRCSVCPRRKVVARGAVAVQDRSHSRAAARSGRSAACGY